MNNLPAEIIFNELTLYMRLSDMANLIECCKHLYYICLKSGWKQLIQNEFSVEKISSTDYRLQYKRLVDSHVIPIISQSNILKWTYFNTKRLINVFEQSKLIAKLYCHDLSSNIKYIITENEQIRFNNLN